MTYIQPVLPFVIAVLFLTIIVFRRRPVIARFTLTGASLLLFFWSWPPLIPLAARGLESGYTTSRLSERGAGAIVVLSAGLRVAGDGRPLTVLDDYSYERTEYAAWLHREREPLPVLASGGPLGPKGRRVVVSLVMRDHLVRSGVPAHLTWTEQKSLSTYQNAVESSRILRGKGIGKVFLVTHGVHLWRAAACFRKQGIDVIPAPCNLMSEPSPMRWTTFIPHWSAMRANEDVLHEWAGLAWYRLSGKI